MTSRLTETETKVGSLEMTSMKNGNEIEILKEDIAKLRMMILVGNLTEVQENMTEIQARILLDLIEHNEMKISALQMSNEMILANLSALPDELASGSNSGSDSGAGSGSGSCSKLIIDQGKITLLCFSFLGRVAQVLPIHLATVEASAWGDALDSRAEFLNDTFDGVSGNTQNCFWIPRSATVTYTFPQLSFIKEIRVLTAQNSSCESKSFFHRSFVILEKTSAFVLFTQSCRQYSKFTA